MKLISGSFARNVESSWIRGFLYSIARFAFFFITTFFLALIGASLLKNFGDYDSHMKSDMKYQTDGKSEKEIVDDLLHYYEFGKTDEAAKIIESKPELLGYIDKNGASLIHLVAKGGKPEGVRLLIKRGADVRKPDRALLFTPLHYAAMSENKENAKILLEQGAVLDAVGKGGKTPLYVAVENRRYQVAEYLLKRGANANVKSEKGITPIVIAISNRYGELIDLLKKYGARE